MRLFFVWLLGGGWDLGFHVKSLEFQVRGPVCHVKALKVHVKIVKLHEEKIGRQVLPLFALAKSIQ
ncbi:hypothetical protein B0H99_104118 [Planomicrobium soli]|uniref:Uncharacterized protein n=1 Tax=Planomicrobium soli TaxID=1176648 RepID=A0A2P8H359_9BACL|nr:hypothetical protein B0H99_104118 [Planomicrobium soli]